MRKGVRGSGGGTRRKGGSLQTKWDRLNNEENHFTGHLWVANKSNDDAKRFSRFLLSFKPGGTYEVRYKRDKNKNKFFSYISPGLGYGKFTFTRTMLSDLASGIKLHGRFNDESHNSRQFRAIQIHEKDKLTQWLSDHQPQLQVRVPPGVNSGGIVRVKAPNGQEFDITVPEGKSPGQVFTVPYPSASAPAQTGPQVPAQTGTPAHNKINLKCEITQTTQTQPPEYDFRFSVDEFEFDVFIHKIYKNITFTIDQDITPSQMMETYIPNEFIPLNKNSPTSTIPANIFPQGTTRGDTCTIRFIPPESYATIVAPFYKVPVRTVTKQYLFYLSYRLGQTLYDMFTDRDVIRNMTPAIWRTLRNVTTLYWRISNQRHDISAIVHLTSAIHSYDKVCGFSFVEYIPRESQYSFGIYEIELPGATPGATPLTLKENRILYSDIVPLTGSLAEWDIEFLNPNDSTPLHSRTCTQWYDLLYENLSGNVIDVKDLEANFEEYGRQCTHVINDPSVSTTHQVVKTHIKKLCQIGSNFYLQNMIKNTIG